VMHKQQSLPKLLTAMHCDDMLPQELLHRKGLYPYLSSSLPFTVL
jgi:hypothetical protein